ncbi:CHASE2 domain-containing protein [Candidatus Poribacteria bacterium]|nr:CHASE2 domain-containing protein [Candidatus Poribacteria bacterium]
MLKTIKRFQLNKYLALFVIGLSPFFLVGAMRYVGGLEFAELKMLDFRSRFFSMPKSEIRNPKSEVNRDIVLITIDGKSQEELGALPWPQGYYLTMLTILQQAKPASVSLMLWFNREWEDSSVFPGKNLFVIRPFSRIPTNPPQHEILEVSAWGSLPDSLYSAQEQSFSLIPLSQEDGIHRHAQLLVREKDSNLPQPLFDKGGGRYRYSLELLAICHHLGIDKSRINIIDSFWRGKYLELPETQGVIPPFSPLSQRGTGGISFNKGGVRIRVPIDAQGRMLVNFVGDINDFSYISFVDALNLYDSEEEKFEQKFSNKIVLIGITTDEAQRSPTPLGQLTALAMRANVINTLLNQNFISRLSRKADISYMGLLCILAATSSVFFYRAGKTTPWPPLLRGNSWLLLIGLILLIVHTLFTLTAFRLWGIWLDFTRPFLAVVISSVVSSFYLGYLRLRELVWKLQTTQKQLVQSEKEAVYGRMTSLVRHEIRNSLGSIRSPAEIVQRNFQKDDPLKMKEHPEMIIREMGRIIIGVEKLNDMVENELSFFKNTNFHFEESDLSEIITSSLNVVKTDIQERNINVSVAIDPNLPLLFVDPDRLRIAFTNLIKNACQAMSKGGELRIEAKYHGLSIGDCRLAIGEKTVSNQQSTIINHQSKDYAVIKFQDTGPGISAEDKEKIFEPFYTTKPRGLGLGLAIVKNVIAGHNGQIEVESQIGIGTTFAVAIPIQAKSNK